LIAAKIPTSFDITIQQNIIQMPLANVVGIIPGKSLPKEYVIFPAIMIIWESIAEESSREIRFLMGQMTTRLGPRG